MTLEQAQALVARIQRETHGVSTVVQADITPADLYSGSFHITVTKPGVLQMCIYSPAQWDDRKHLIKKWASHSEEEKERKGMFFEKKSYDLGNGNKAISYEVSDDNAHTVQITEEDARKLLSKLLASLRITREHALSLIDDIETQREHAGDDMIQIHGCYPSRDAMETGHILPIGHDDDTGVFSFLFDEYAKETKEGENIRYTFKDGTVLIRRGGVIETEQEIQEAAKDNKA